MRALLIAGSLAAAGCVRPVVVTEPVEVEIVRYETVPVPEALLKACKVSLGTLNSNQDLELALAAALIELKRCTADKEQIRGLE